MQKHGDEREVDQHLISLKLSQSVYHLISEPADFIGKQGKIIKSFIADIIQMVHVYREQTTVP